MGLQGGHSCREGAVARVYSLSLSLSHRTPPLRPRSRRRAVQGAFREHVQMLNDLDGVSAIECRTAAELENLDGLVLPGGESTTMGCVRAGIRRSQRSQRSQFHILYRSFC